MLTVNWHGKPVERAQVTVEGPGIKEALQGETNAQGQFVCQLPEAGLYSIRARRIEETAGEFKGKKYASIRQYSTLALPYVPVQVMAVDGEWPDLPRATTSFGAGVVGDDLYVYGGHYGRAHHYSREGQSGDFRRLNLSSPEKWEDLPGGPRLTGLAMVAYGGQLYRVGGFTAENDDNEDERLISQDDFARFDPKKGEWEELPPLPEGRSSHDIAVLGDTLYVVGGWEMTADGEDRDRHWHTTAWACDLSAPKLEWKPVPTPPFQRRAISLAAHDGKLYVIGGMQPKGGPTTRVDVFDPASETWSDGPSILGGPMDGFGTASFAVNGKLYTTTMSGAVQRLAEDGSKWEFVGQMAHPRFFHEMTPWKDSLVIVGGASMQTGKISELERLSTEKTGESVKKAALLK